MNNIIAWKPFLEEEQVLLEVSCFPLQGTRLVVRDQ